MYLKLRERCNLGEKLLDVRGTSFQRKKLAWEHPVYVQGILFSRFVPVYVSFISFLSFSLSHSPSLNFSFSFLPHPPLLFLSLFSSRFPFLSPTLLLSSYLRVLPPPLRDHICTGCFLFSRRRAVFRLRGDFLV